MFLNLESRMVRVKQLEGNKGAEKVKSVAKHTGPSPVMSRLTYTPRQIDRKNPYRIVRT